MDNNDQVIIENNVWVSTPNQLAARVECRDLEGFFKKNLVVEQGTRALLLEGNNNIGELEAGVYTIDSFFGRLNNFGKSTGLTAIITKNGDIELDFGIDGCLTNNGSLVEMVVQVGVKIADQAMFARNMLGSAAVFTKHQLRVLCFNNLKSVLKRKVLEYSIEELYSDIELIEEFEHYIAYSLSDFFESTGVQFNNVQAFDFKHEKYDEMKKENESCYLLLEKEKAELENKKRFDELYSEKERYEINKNKLKNQYTEMLREINRNNDKAVLQDEIERFEQMDRVRARLDKDRFAEQKLQENEIYEILMKIDKDKLLRDDEYLELKQKLENKNYDAESAREHMLLVLDKNREAEIKEIIEKMNNDLELQQLTHKHKLAQLTDSEDNRKKVVRIEGLLVEANGKLYRDRVKRKNRKEERDAQLGAMIKDWKARTYMRNADEIDRRERENKDSLVNEKIKRRQHKTEYIKYNRYRKNEIEDMNLFMKFTDSCAKQDIEMKKADTKIAQDKADNKAKIEKDMLEAYAKYKTEALLMISDSDEKTKILGELARIEKLKEGHTELILALELHRTNGSDSELTSAILETLRAIQ